MATLRLFITALVLDIFFFLFAFVWYEILFKKPYTTALKLEKRKEQRKGLGGKLFIAFLLTFVAISIIGVVVESGYKGRQNGFYLGLLFWSVYAAVEMINSIFLRIPQKVQLINSFYWLIALVTSGTVLGIVL